MSSKYYGHNAILVRRSRNPDTSRVSCTPRRVMQMYFLSFPKENLLYFHIWIKIKKNPTKTGKWKQKHLDFGEAGTSFQLNNCQQHLQLPAMNRCSRNNIISRRMCWVEGVEWVMLGCDLLIKMPTDACVKQKQNIWPKYVLLQSLTFSDFNCFLSESGET